MTLPRQAYREKGNFFLLVLFDCSECRSTAHRPLAVKRVHSHRQRWWLAASPIAADTAFRAVLRCSLHGVPVDESHLPVPVERAEEVVEKLRGPGEEGGGGEGAGVSAEGILSW